MLHLFPVVVSGILKHSGAKNRRADPFYGASRHHSEADAAQEVEYIGGSILAPAGYTSKCP